MSVARSLTGAVLSRRRLTSLGERATLMLHERIIKGAGGSAAPERDNRRSARAGLGRVDARAGTGSGGPGPLDALAPGPRPRGADRSVAGRARRRLSRDDVPDPHLGR